MYWYNAHIAVFQVQKWAIKNIQGYPQKWDFYDDLELFKYDEYDSMTLDS